MEIMKAILFDMDWVLIDACERHYEALNKALDLFWFTITRQEHENYYDWLPTKIKLNKLSEEKGLPRSLHQFINEMKQQYTVDAVYNNSTIDFSKQILLKKLKDKWFKLWVCSNSIKKTIDIMLEKAMLYGYFDIILSNEDVTESKPSPEIYLTAMTMLWVKPENVYIVEDSEHWIRAAKAAGAKVLEVSNSAEVNLWLFKNIL